MRRICTATVDCTIPTSPVYTVSYTTEGPLEVSIVGFDWANDGSCEDVKVIGYAVGDTPGDCGAPSVAPALTCCTQPCFPHVLGNYTTNSEHPTWDLSPYLGPGVAGCSSGMWRLVETGYNLTYNTGSVAADGTLVGLPASFTGSSYNGYMELRIECP
jgi:hypothetical protein